MNKEEEFVIMEWNKETKEFWFLGKKIDYIHNPEEWRKYLNDLVTENKQLKKKYENAVADYELEKYKNNKAIEYIKKWSIYYEKDKKSALFGNANDLLEILGDKENE